MKISKESKKAKIGKGVKKYGVDGKLHVVEYYLMGIYSTKEILEKYGVSRILLLQWLGWYYRYFQSENYNDINYGKGKIRKCDVFATGSGQGTGGRGKAPERAAEKGSDQEPESGNIAGFSTPGSAGRGRGQAAKKKHWTEVVARLKQEYPQSTMEELCDLFDKSRQAWYKSENAKIKQFYDEQVIVEEVKRIREHLKKCGGRKLYHMMSGFLENKQIKIGRDKFFDVLRKHNLLIKKRKKTAKTTNSNHSLRRYPNIVQDLEVSGSNQLWVSDITYIRLPGTFCYLSLITDAYSRKIVGWHLAKDLTAESTIKALEMALEQLTTKPKSLIHHSDRGVQYCSKMYVSLLKKHGIKISMTEQGDPYENILAERMNRTIKEEFLDMVSFATYKEALKITEKSVALYNGMRPHASLDYLTPDQAHRLAGHLKKRWKNYGSTKNKAA